MSAMAYRITIAYTTQRFIQAQIKQNQSSASLAFVSGIHRWPVKSPHKGQVTRKMPPFDDVIMGEASVVRRGSWWKSWMFSYPYELPFACLAILLYGSTIIYVARKWRICGICLRPFVMVSCLGIFVMLLDPSLYFPAHGAKATDKNATRKK